MKRPCLIVLCLLAFAADLFAQSDTLISRFSAYRETSLRERIYVHTDRSFYVCGEIIWFKVYATAGPFNRPDSLSRVAYLEVLDSENNPVMQAKVELNAGTGSGSLEIPFRLASGKYRLRAYTRWMRNFSPDYYFEKQLTVVNTTRPLPSTEDGKRLSADSIWDLQFFPEGGDLVQGLKSRVAFKAVNGQGKGVEFTGILINASGDTLGRFQPLKYGMGSFFFTPSAGGRPYTALVRTPDGQILNYPLPEARRHGYVLQLEESGKGEINKAENSKGEISVTVNSNDPTAVDAPVYLFVHTRHHIRLAEMKKLQNGETVFRIAIDSLGEGISHFTLFNASLQPVAERLYFKRPEKRLFIAPDASQTMYEQRSEVELEIAARDAGGGDVPANMSVAVYLLDSLEQAPEADIFSNLWLSSDLRGSIEDPAYYLYAKGPEAEEAIDHLMLTQGWRRFNWQDVLQRRYPSYPYAPEYQGHTLTGIVKDIRSGLPVPSVMAYLSVPGKIIRMRSSLSDEEGRVRFNMDPFYGPVELVLQTGKDSTMQVQMMNPFSEEFSSNARQPLRPGEAVRPGQALRPAEAILPGQVLRPGQALPPAEVLEVPLRLRNKAMHVQKTYWGTALQQFLPPADQDSLPFYYKPDKTYFLDDYVRFTTMEEVMREYVPEVIVRKRDGKFRFLTMNMPVFALYGNSGPNVFFQENPLVLLDGVPVFDIDRIISYDPLKVERLEIVGRKYYLGPLAAGGILSYTTYKGNLEGFRLDPGSLVLDYEGLQLQREYYSPSYERVEASARLPDFRTLLYWSPCVKTVGRNSAKVFFHTSDIPGTYLVIVQGITPSGHMGSGSFRFRVKE